MERRRNLLKKDLRRNLFYLFAGWSGKFGAALDGASASSSSFTSASAADRGKSAGEDSNAAASAASAAAAAAAIANSGPPITEFEFSALRVSFLFLFIVKFCGKMTIVEFQAMVSVLCCGPCFDEGALVEEGSLYTLLDVLLSSKEKKVGQQQQTVRSFVRTQ